jgi:multidrug efflux pump subunit AcrA (membrane-fusion protein)
LLGVVLTRHRGPTAAGNDGAFVCPMHPDVTAAATGTCPICGMALVRTRSLPRDPAQRREDGASDEDSVAIAQILSQAANGVADNLIGYYPAALRDHFFRYEAYAPAWMETDADVAVLLYRDQLPALDPAEVVTFSPASRPEAAFETRIHPDRIEEWDASLSLVHFRLDPEVPAPAPPRGTVVWVKFPARPRHMQVIPVGAVLESSEGPYALVIGADRRSASKRPISVGRTVTGLAAIVGGLALHEQVVSANAFFWDAERRLQPEHLAASGSAR